MDPKKPNKEKRFKAIEKATGSVVKATCTKETKEEPIKEIKLKGKDVMF